MANKKHRVQNVKTGAIKHMTEAAIKALKENKMFGDFDILPDDVEVVTGVPPGGLTLEMTLDPNEGVKTLVKQSKKEASTPDPMPFSGPYFDIDGEMLPDVHDIAALKIDFEPTK